MDDLVVYHRQETGLAWLGRMATLLDIQARLRQSLNLHWQSNEV